MTAPNRTKQQHTPGPYQVHRDMGDVFIISAGNPREADCIAKLFKPYEHRAPLFAAAPDLLVALKYLAAQIDLSKLNVRKDFSLMNGHAGALKAIAKAEGHDKR